MRGPAVFLCNASKRLAHSLELEDTLRSMADLCVPEFGQACVLYFFKNDLTDGQVGMTKHVDPEREELLTALAQRAFADRDRCQILRQVACTRHPLVLSQLETAQLIGDGRAAHVLQNDLQLKTSIIVPVAERAHVLGVTICFADSAHWYTHRQVRIVRELSDRFALAVTAAQMYRACQVALDATQEMVATTIHDLMSPLTYIKGSAQRLRRLDWSKADASIGTEMEQRLSAIDAAVTRMASAMSTLVASTNPNPTSLDKRPLAEPADLVRIAGEVVGLEQLIAPDHALHLTVDTPAPMCGMWDTSQIHRMLANVVNNAVKYSPAGSSVEIHLSAESSQDRHWAVLRVKDHGIGIPTSDLPFIFEPFRRGGNVGLVAGTGLGLASVWQTVTTHGGRLCAESQVGEGTVVTIQLPLATSIAD